MHSGAETRSPRATRQDGAVDADQIARRKRSARYALNFAPIDHVGNSAAATRARVPCLIVVKKKF
jgi:hypothetical protein